MREGNLLSTLWESDTVGARIARAALTPAEIAFGAITAVRSSLYSSGILPTQATALPALSVGNLTVGGTGKTPIAAHLAARLADLGALPAIVLRGYGEDEPLVHRVLNPNIAVIVSADRVSGVAQAKAAGCDVVVLDDAFQHRRARRVADVVLVSADAWRPGRRRHLLPAGPWRERLTAARRASIAIVTRKAATRDQADQVASAIASAANVPVGIVHLSPGSLRDIRGDAMVPIDELRGRSVLAISAIGDPAAFVAQLAAAGARVTSAAFRDHYRFGASDIATLAGEARRYDRVVCTLKDAVKLAPLWPGGSPVWYVSQRVVEERGAKVIDRILTTTLAARPASTHNGWSGSPEPRE